MKRLTKEVNKRNENVKSYLEDVDEKHSEMKEVERRIEECEERESARKNNLSAVRQQHTNALDEREALPAQPEGVDLEEEGSLIVRAPSLMIAVSCPEALMRLST